MKARQIKMAREHNIGLILKAYSLFIAGEKPALLSLKKIEAFPSLKVVEEPPLAESA